MMPYARNKSPLAETRRNKGWHNLTLFAERAGYSVGYLCDFERGRRGSEAVVLVYQQLLDMTREQILERVPGSPLPPAHAKVTRGPRRKFSSVMLSNRLAQWRIAAGKTQAQVGHEVGVSARTVSYWENGNQFPPLCRVAPLARALGVPEADVRAACTLPATHVDTTTVQLVIPTELHARLCEHARWRKQDPGELIVEWAQDAMDLEDKYERKVS